MHGNTAIALYEHYNRETRAKKVKSCIELSVELREALETSISDPMFSQKNAALVKEMQSHLGAIRGRNDERSDSIFDDALRRTEKHLLKAMNVVRHMVDSPEISMRRWVVDLTIAVNRLSMDINYLSMACGGWDSLRSFNIDNCSTLQMVPVKQVIAAMKWFWSVHFGTAVSVPFVPFCRAFANTMGLPIYMFRASTVCVYFLHTMKYFFMYHIRLKQRVRPFSVRGPQYPENVIMAVRTQLTSLMARHKDKAPIQIIASRGELYSYVGIAAFTERHTFVNRLGLDVLGEKRDRMSAKLATFKVFSVDTHLPVPSEHHPFCVHGSEYPAVARMFIIRRADSSSVEVMAMGSCVSKCFVAMFVEVGAAATEPVMAPGGSTLGNGLIAAHDRPHKRPPRAILQDMTSLEPMNVGSSSDSDYGSDVDGFDPNIDTPKIVNTLFKAYHDGLEPVEDAPAPQRRLLGLITKRTAGRAQQAAAERALLWTLEAPAPVLRYLPNHVRPSGETYEEVCLRRAAKSMERLLGRARELRGVAKTRTEAIRVVLLGGVGSGKSSLMARLRRDVPGRYIPTRTVTGWTLDHLGPRVDIIEVPARMAAQGRAAGLGLIPRCEVAVLVYDVSGGVGPQLGTLANRRSELKLEARQRKANETRAEGVDAASEARELAAKAAEEHCGHIKETLFGHRDHMRGVIVGNKYDLFSNLGCIETVTEYRGVAQALGWPHILASARTGDHTEAGVLSAVLDGVVAALQDRAGGNG